MKVESEQSTKITTAPRKMSPDEIKARIKSKFGKDLSKKKPIKAVEDKVEVSKQAKKTGETPIGDIGSNDPKSDMTQSKIKGLLRNGGFEFSEGERKALSSILK
ncbi:MAG: hypothetical protein ACJAS4_002129 [Bacteriovoracaceae bacterium]|jgi:hypothetical protein